MKVLINGLGVSMGGGLRHLSNFLPALSKVDPGTEYIVLTREIANQIRVGRNIRLELMPEYVRSASLRRLYADTVEVPLRLRKGRFDVVVSLMNFGPVWSPVRHILFQRNSIYFCPYFLEVAPLGLRLETLARRRLILASMMRADVIVTPTDSMADLIRSSCPASSSRLFRTLYHGFELSAMGRDANVGQALVFRPDAGPNLLFPNHPGRHKAADILLRAMAVLREREFRATLYLTMERADHPAVVDELAALARALRIEDRVVFLGRVPQESIARLYQQADLMVYPSLCESFGFALVEAMGHGLPVVAAGTAVNREVCGDAALYYDPLDPHAAAGCIASAFDAGARDRLRAAGRARISSYDWSWSRYARQFADLVHER